MYYIHQQLESPLKLSSLVTDHSWPHFERWGAGWHKHLTSKGWAFLWWVDFLESFLGTICTVAPRSLWSSPRVHREPIVWLALYSFSLPVSSFSTCKVCPAGLSRLPAARFTNRSIIGMLKVKDIQLIKMRQKFLPHLNGRLTLPSMALTPVSFYAKTWLDLC